MTHAWSSGFRSKTNLPQLLADVERGETIVITRHGRAIARIVPEVSERPFAMQKIKADIDNFRRTLPKMSVEDILSSRHEGHKY